MARSRDQFPYRGGTVLPGFSEDPEYIDDMVLAALFGALVNLNGSGNYIHWGFIQISVANLIVIGLMVVVFVLAILLPFPRRKGDRR